MYRQKFYYCLLFIFTGGLLLQAQRSSALKPLYLDTVSYRPSPFKAKMDEITDSKAFRITYIGVPLFAAGILIKGPDRRFYDMRNSYIPKFHHTFDNYLQYAPAFAMVGLKAAGVEGRNSWGRMLVSDAFSAGLMAIAVNSIKYTAKAKRPHGNSHNSFPSGHTATAFMTATMLHKEYGLTRSPWYSIGGYTVATTTAVMRIMNNRHWLSDILAGAGIGIVSTELGYYLADLIFKDKGVRHELIDFSGFDYERPPSYIGMYMGFGFMPTHIPLSPGFGLEASAGANAGFEGAWFANRNWGIGGKISVTSMPLSVTGKITDNTDPDKFYPEESVESDPLDIVSGYVGPYFSLPLTKRCAWASKVLAGCHYRLASSIYAFSPGKPEQRTVESRQEIARTEHSYGFALGAGTSIAYTVTPNLNVRVFADYDMMPSHFNTSLRDGDNIISKSETNKTLHTFTVGASFNITFW